MFQHSLFGDFMSTARTRGASVALRALAGRFAALAVPLAEVAVVVLSVYIARTLVLGKQNRMHSALLDGSVTPAREPPTDIMKPHFFQNRQGLWIHHGKFWNEKYGIPKGVVVFFHGYSEHSRRFIHLAEHLNEAGLIMFVMDHQGFGRSEGDRAHVEDFMHYIDDAMQFMKDIVYDDHPELQLLPRFIMGHSMGGLISIHTALRCQKEDHPAYNVVGVMLSAPAVDVDPAHDGIITTFVGGIVRTLFPKAEVLSFPAEPSTSNLQVKFHAMFDPLNYQGGIRIHHGMEMLRAMKIAVEKAPEFKLPIFISHGSDDRHVRIEGSRKFMDLISSKDKTLLELPDLQHEPIHEIPEIRGPLLDKFVTWALERIETNK